MCLFRLICMSSVWVCLVVLCVLMLFCSLSGSIMFLSVVRCGINWNDWNMNLIVLLCSVVCLFLLSWLSVWLSRWIVLFVVLFNFVSRLSSVDLFDFDVLMIVRLLFGCMVSVMLLRIVSLFVVLVICLYMLWILMIGLVILNMDMIFCWKRCVVVVVLLGILLVVIVFVCVVMVLVLS